MRRPENAAGDFFVDTTCIDCDTCRWMAPSVFARRGPMSAVAHQPQGASERRAALHALLSCPTASIGTTAKAPDLAVAQREFPIPIVGDVFHCGYHSPDSFGAASYFIRRPGGNVLIDSPRFTAPLVRQLDEMGGVAWMLLTHRDDVADHDKFATHFGLRRVIHARDAGGVDAETVLEGDNAAQILPGLMAIPTPGHTAGHMVFLWAQSGGVLFTGDHLAYDDEAGHLEAWPDVCWHDWGAQTASMRRLTDIDFEWVLPGHGRRVHLDEPTMKRELLRLLAWMTSQA